MIRKNPSGHLPVIDESAYIDKTAIICGKVIIKENVFVGPYAVIRADEVDASGDMEPIVIGANSTFRTGSSSTPSPALRSPSASTPPSPTAA